jgi:hypothetical protein
MGVCQVLTALIYLASIFMYTSFFNLAYVFSATFCFQVITILGLCWLPLHLGQVLSYKLDPSDSSKVMQTN